MWARRGVGERPAGSGPEKPATEAGWQVRPSKNGGDSSGQRLLGLSEAEAEGRFLPEAYALQPSGLPPLGRELSNDLLRPKPPGVADRDGPPGVRTPADCLVPLRRDHCFRTTRCAMGTAVRWARSGLGHLETHHLLSVEALAQRGDPAAGPGVQRTHPCRPTPAPWRPLTGAPVLRLSLPPPGPRSQPRPWLRLATNSGLARSLTCNVATNDTHQPAWSCTAVVLPLRWDPGAVHR